MSMPNSFANLPPQEMPIWIYRATVTTSATTTDDPVGFIIVPNGLMRVISAQLGANDYGAGRSCKILHQDSAANLIQSLVSASLDNQFTQMALMTLNDDAAYAASNTGAPMIPYPIAEDDRLHISLNGNAVSEAITLTLRAYLTNRGAKPSITKIGGSAAIVTTYDKVI